MITMGRITPKNYTIGYDGMHVRKINFLKFLLEITDFRDLIT